MHRLNLTFQKGFPFGEGDCSRAMVREQGLLGAQGLLSIQEQLATGNGEEPG